MHIICLDLEGVLVPEIWIGVAEKTGIPDLRLTTRDITDYDKLMQHRLAILDKHKIKLVDIQEVIATLKPLPGALEFLDWLRLNSQVLILSDTFQEFAKPLMQQLKMPTIFCHSLNLDENGFISGYQLRIADHKRKSIIALKNLNFITIAAGDSYNDTSMLSEAHHGFLYKPPANVIKDFPQFPVIQNYDELKKKLEFLFND